MKKALITGALGQDGSYMAELLLGLGYEVWGTARGSTLSSGGNFISGVRYAYADIRDELSLLTLLRRVEPDEIYNFAGQSTVPASIEYPVDTFDVNTNGFMRLMRCVEKLQFKNTRVYQASSATMYGKFDGKGQVVVNENTSFNPITPYSISKYAAHRIVEMYRDKGYYVVGGILFNHESPRRTEDMVTRKITRAVAQYAIGEKPALKLGTITTVRDWGYASDYVKAMYKMLQQDIPEDFVIGTGIGHTVQEFLKAAMQAADVRTIDLVPFSSDSLRHSETYTILADATKAAVKLGWVPETNFLDLVKLMVLADIKEAQRMVTA
jgi:GDPmannose 4,6-dehydratase